MLSSNTKPVHSFYLIDNGLLVATIHMRPTSVNQMLVVWTNSQRPINLILNLNNHYQCNLLFEITQERGAHSQPGESGLFCIILTHNLCFRKLFIKILPLHGIL